MRFGALGVAVRSELRYRWRSWLTLALLVSVVGGVVLGATAAGRRTASAFPRFTARYGYDALAYSFQPSLPKIPKLPEVASSTFLDAPATGTPVCRCLHPLSQVNFGITASPSLALARFLKLVDGRLPTRPDEALASFSFARDEGIHVGSLVRVPFYAPSQLEDVVDNTPGAPAGPTVTFHVVGIEAAEGDFPSVGSLSYTLVPGAAFSRAYDTRIALFHVYLVRLRHGVANVARFDQDAVAAGAAGTSDVSELDASVQAGIHPQAVGWWVLALLAGLAGLAIVGQALSRQSNVEADEYRTLAALGLGPGDLMALGLGRALLIGLAGAAGAVVLAFAVSPIAPLGEARVAEPSTGLQFDGLVLGLGGLAIVVIVLLLALWPAYRTSRATRDTGGVDRPSQIVAKVAAAGAPPSAVIGVRRALDRGLGRESVPVGSALGGAVLAVAALCATAVFGTSLTNLVASPRLYGQDFQVWFNGFTSVDSVNPLVAQLRGDKAIRAVTLGLQQPVEINGVPTHSIAGSPLQGAVLISAASGRLAQRPGEVALGSKTLRQAHAHVGGTVAMTFPLESGGSRTIAARVVGTASLPPDFGVVGLGVGAYMSYDGFMAAQCPSGPASVACRTAVTQNPVVLVSTTGGHRGAGAVAHYAAQFPGLAYLPVKPDNLVNFGEAVNFPLILGFVLVLFGLSTLLHVLVVSVARRRRELGLLKAIGLMPQQVLASVSWQATTIALVGLVVGLPLGIISGRAIWHAFAVNLGVVPATVIDAGTLTVISVGVLVAANLLAIGPALVAARAKPNSLLRSE